MAKKKNTPRRVPRSFTPRTFGDGKPSYPAAGGADGQPDTLRSTGEAARTLSPRRPVFSARPSEMRSHAPLSQEYHYVVGDLRRLGIVFGGTLAVMLILGMFLR